MVETWATDGTALAELIESPDATGARFDLDAGAVAALRDADRFAPDPARRTRVRRTPVAATISFETGLTVTGGGSALTFETGTTVTGGGSALTFETGSTITGGSALTFETGSTITGGSALTFETGSTITGGSALTFETGSTVTGNPSPR